MRTRIVYLVLLLAACGPVPPESTDSAPPLLEAASRGDLDSLNRLLSGGNPPDLRDACRWTPLMKAAIQGHREVVERLLAAGAEVDAQDSGGYTALMLAASNNHIPVVEVILAHGARIDHQEQTKGWTALIWAANRGHRGTLAVLLAQGADPSIRDFGGRNAADWAAEQNHPDLAALLTP